MDKVHSLFVDKDGFISETPPPVIDDKPKRKRGRPKGSGKKKKTTRYKKVLKGARKFQPVDPPVQDTLKDLTTLARMFGISDERMAHEIGVNRETIRSFRMGTFGQRKTAKGKIERLIAFIQGEVAERLLCAQKAGVIKITELIPTFKKTQLRKTKITFTVTGVSEDDRATDLGEFTLSLSDLIEAQAERYREIAEKHRFRKSIVEVFVDTTRHVNQ